jgi:hypothetical protein
MDDRAGAGDLVDDLQCLIGHEGNRIRPGSAEQPAPRSRRDPRRSGRLAGPAPESLGAGPNRRAFQEVR